MKVAVCISGQSRTWNIAKENIKNYFGDVDYFIHTWDINTYRVENLPKNEPKIYDVTNEEIKDIEDYFNPKLLEFDHYSDDYAYNWHALFYSFMKSVWLKRKYEIENDFLYDIVIKTRFDLNFRIDINPNFIYHEVEPLVAYSLNSRFPKFSYEFNYNSIDDAIFYSDSPTMDLISNVCRWNKNILDESKNQISKNEFIKNVEFYYGPGSLLYKHLVNYGIHPKCITDLNYYIVRENAIGLHSIDDWYKIFNIYEKFNSDVIEFEKNKKNV
jgi:hypothetical protein